MGARMSAYKRAMNRHERVLAGAGCLYTDDVLSGDLVLICEMVPTGMQSTAGGYASHAVMNPALLKGIKRSQLGKPVHMSSKDISGFNRTGVIVCDRLGDKFVLEATARGVESTRLDDCVAAVHRNSGIIALRQVDCPEGRKFARPLLRIFDATKEGPLTWERAKEVEAAMAAGEKTELALEMAAKLCQGVLQSIRHSKKVLSVETKAELDQMFSLYDRNGDGTIDEEELETMIDEIGGKAMSTEDRLKILTKLDVDNDGGISLEEFYKAMRELPGITSLDDRNIATLLSAQFTLKVYMAIGLLRGVAERMYVDADMLKFDAEVDFEWLNADFYPEVPLRVRPGHEASAKSSRLSKIPASAMRRRDARRKARAAARAQEQAEREQARTMDAERRQRLAEREQHIRQQIEQARMFKEKEREYQNQLRQEEDRQRRAKEEEIRMKKKREERAKSANPAGRPGAARVDAGDDGDDGDGFGDDTVELPQDAANTKEGLKRDAAIANKDFAPVVAKAAALDQDSLQYYYVDFELLHTGVTAGVVDKEGRQVWAVVDVRPSSEAADEGVEPGHLLVSVGDVDLEDGALSLVQVNRQLRSGARPLNVSFAAPDEDEPVPANGSAGRAAGGGGGAAAAKATEVAPGPAPAKAEARAEVERSRTGTELADDEFEVVFQEDDLGFTVAQVEEDGKPCIIVADVAEDTEAYEAEVMEEYFVVTVGGTKITGANCTEDAVNKLLQGKRPLSVVFAS